MAINPGPARIPVTFTVAPDDLTPEGLSAYRLMDDATRNAFKQIMSMKAAMMLNDIGEKEALRVGASRPNDN